MLEVSLFKNFFIDHFTHPFVEFRTRKYALSPIGQKATVASSTPLDGSTSLTASVIIGLNDDLALPFFYDVRAGSNTADDFALFVTLAVSSGFLKPGDFLVFDNAAVHADDDTVEELTELFQQHQITVRRLPTYSPELNPIERCFRIIKTYLRYHRDPAKSLLDDIITGFALIDHEIVAKEYIRSLNYFLLHPFTLPRHMEELLDLPPWLRSFYSELPEKS